MSDTQSGLRFPDLPKLELDQLIDQLVERAQDVKRAQGRLRALLHAIETVTGDLALEVVLRNVVESALELAHASYGALGVIGPDGGLEQFIHVGIDDATAARIGALPQGKGLLGALISDPRPIRLRHMTDDPRSTGFPPNHPPMQSFLGVPIHVRDEVFGNLYLADSDRGEFTAEDEQLVGALALAAGTAISNARLYHESRLQQRWLEASVEIGSQLLASAGEDPLRMVARKAIEISDADVVAVCLTTPDGTAFVVEEMFGTRAEELIGRRFPLAGSMTGLALERDEPMLIANASGADHLPTFLSSVMEAGPLMVLPLRGTGSPRGALSLCRAKGRRAFTARDVAMADGFASHASVALELADSRAAEQKLVLLEDRDRIARDLHDHVIQELFAIGLSLEGSAAQIAGRNDVVAQRVRQRVEDIDRTIRRIRTSIFELRGTLATMSEGLRQRVLEVASDLTPALGFAPHVAFAGVVDVRVEDEMMQDVVACVRETLTNVAKHARATSAVVDVSLAHDVLTVTVSDNGVGLRDSTRSSGTANLRARAEKWGGSFELMPGTSGGTTAIWKVHI
ncbi:MAG TPA: GAF domain-containing protein [Jatrophihabitans sp.]|nr:GAF domain-containing protein [Jatrophihabitans sp.]